MDRVTEHWTLLCSVKTNGSAACDHGCDHHSWVKGLHWESSVTPCYGAFLWMHAGAVGELCLEERCVPGRLCDLRPLAGLTSDVESLPSFWDCTSSIMPYLGPHPPISPTSLWLHYGCLLDWCAVQVNTPGHCKAFCIPASFSNRVVHLYTTLNKGSWQPERGSMCRITPVRSLGTFLEGGITKAAKAKWRLNTVPVDGLGLNASYRGTLIIHRNSLTNRGVRKTTLPHTDILMNFLTIHQWQKMQCFACHVTHISETLKDKWELNCSIDSHLENIRNVLTCRHVMQFSDRPRTEILVCNYIV